MHTVSFILVIVGALNWLLYGLFGWEVGQFFGGMDAGISKIVYILVGIGGLYMLFTHKKDCKMCDKGMAMGAKGSM